jgi:hypothetical protein
VALRIHEGVYKVLKVSNPAILDRVSVGDDTISIFHQEDGAWKCWDNYVLGARPVQ